MTRRKTILLPLISMICLHFHRLSQVEIRSLRSPQKWREKARLEVLLQDNKMKMMPFQLFLTRYQVMITHLYRSRVMRQQRKKKHKLNKNWQNLKVTIQLLLSLGQPWHRRYNKKLMTRMKNLIHQTVIKQQSRSRKISRKSQLPKRRDQKRDHLQIQKLCNLKAVFRYRKPQTKSSRKENQ